MAQVLLTIGDRSHYVTCADGGEARLAELGRMLDARWPAARRGAGNAGSERTLLLLALMLADDLDEAVARPAPAPAPDDTLDRLADRLERLAAALEREAPAS